MLSGRALTVSSLLFVTLSLVACGGGGQGDGGSAADSAAAALAADTTTLIRVANRGLEQPESIVYDSVADVYLVSNISVDPLVKDDNGFISQVTPAGRSEGMLRWINGEDDDVTLHAPKGLAIHGDTLFVADIDSVRAFDRVSGRPLGARGVPGATFLNGLAVGPDGTLYVTDSGLGEGLVPNGKDAVYRFGPTGATAVATGAALFNPSGIIVHEDDLYVVGFGSPALLRIPTAGGPPATVTQLPAGQLDGLVRLPDGSFLISSWESGSVYKLGPEGSVQKVAADVESPAGIGWDSRRRRVLIPLLTPSEIQIRPVR